MNGSVSRCTQPGEVAFTAVLPTGEGWFMPRHHVGVSPTVAPLVASWIAESDDPVGVAVHLYSRIRDSSSQH